MRVNHVCLPTEKSVGEKEEMASCQVTESYYLHLDLVLFHLSGIESISFCPQEIRSSLLVRFSGRTGEVSYTAGLAEGFHVGNWAAQCMKGTERRQRKKGERSLQGSHGLDVGCSSCSTLVSREVDSCLPILGSPLQFIKHLYIQDLSGFLNTPMLKKWLVSRVNIILYNIPLNFQVFESDYWASNLN